MLEPRSPEELAALLAAGRGPLRVQGGGTKPWAAGGGDEGEVLSTLGLARIVEHEEGDLTAVVQAGVRLADLQAHVAGAGQVLMLDPPDGGATVGGVVASGDSGPLRHRYGGPRDLVLGVQVALGDGTLARSGGKVIKNVAGYDLAKLLTGSCGTLGVLCEVAVRLHPLPHGTATVVRAEDDPEALGRAASTLARARIETEALDVRWHDGGGHVLARYAGRAAGDLAAAAAALVGGEVVEDDDAWWDAQRSAQRAAQAGPAPTGQEDLAHADAEAVVRVSGVLSRLPDVLRAAQELGASVVGRAALGLSWVRLEHATPEAVATLRQRLAPMACVVQDAPPAVRASLDPWGPVGAAELELMQRIKAQFDPAGALAPGTYVGGI